jgi:hypothetical protein
MNLDYWQKQTSDKPLFPDIEWSKPQQKAQLGKLLIVGGTTHGFSAVVKSYSAALEAGAGQVKVALPDKLKNSLPPDFSDGVFLPTNPSGALSKDGEEQLITSAKWADGVLLVGDSGMNSETEVLFDKLLSEVDTWLTITRDSFDLLLNSAPSLVSRPQTHLLLNFPQVQKLFSAVYYPKILTSSMQFTSLVEALHKFTITYPLTLTVLFNGQIIVSHAGQIVTQNFPDQMSLINGALSARTAAYLLWNPKKPLEAIVTSWQ